MAQRNPGEVHWIVRTNWKSRSFLSALLFVTIGAHLVSSQSGALAWILLCLQFLAYPQLAYWRAVRAQDQLAAEWQNFLADPFFLGAWCAALGFPAWISFACFATTTFGHVMYYRWKGALRATALMGAGALAVLLVAGWRYTPETDLPATLLSMVTLTLYVLLVAERAHFRAATLQEARDRLRKNEVLLTQKLEEIESLQAQLREQAVRDPLTGLYNRRFLGESLARELSRCERAGHALSILMIDVDHFKGINDAWGHQVGDEVLKSLARLVQELVRPTDLAFRYGGEEFLILMPGMSLELAGQRAEQLRSVFAGSPLMLDGRALPATISIGVAGGEGCVDPDQLVRGADTALYQAKADGRNRVVVRRPAPDTVGLPPDGPDPRETRQFTH